MEPIKQTHRGECLVCGHPQGSAHFGSTSCLACAAFFRRTVSLDIKFICKKNNDCRVFHELRMVCRACRFLRCLASGLQPNMVQKRRVRKRENLKEDEKDLPSPILGTTNIEDSPSVSFSSDPLSPFEPSSEGIQPRIDILPPTSQPSLPLRSPSPVDSPSSSFEGTNLLTHYVLELRKAMDRRFLMFSDQPMAVVTGYEKLPFLVGEKKPHSMKRQFESQKIDHLLAYDYCTTTPGWHDMTPDEKVLFFRIASMSYCLLDIGWITCLAIEPSERLVMFTDGSVASVDDLSIGWDDEQDIGTSGSKDEKRKIFFEFVRRLHSALILPMCDFGLDEVEYAALKALCVWKMGYVEYSCNLKALGKTQERALLLGLDAHYEDREDKAERLGNLILLMGTIFELFTSLKELYYGITLFDLLNIDLVSKQLLAL